MEGDGILGTEKAEKIIDILKKTYPDAKCQLNYATSFQLLTATILSAQTTDKKVNAVTSKLFKEYDTPDKILKLSQGQLEDFIREIGLYRNKAKNILAMCKMLIEDYNGKVPQSMDELIKLPGVGRKTADVVLSNAFNIPAIAVDTHVFRVSNRIGLANSKNVYETEKQLMKNIEKKDWSLSHHLLIFHGRNVCTARNPKCSICAIKQYCDYTSGVSEIH